MPINNQDIKKENEQTSPTGTDNVLVSRNALEDMQKRLKKLEGKNNDVIEDEENKTRIARLRVYEDKLVIGFNKKKGVWKNFDPARREERLIHEIILLDDNGKETSKSVDYLNFLEEASTKEFPIVDIKKTPIIKEKGLIHVREVVDYKTVQKKDKVMQKVVSSEDTVIIKMPDGSNREIDIDAINY